MSLLPDDEVQHLLNNMNSSDEDCEFEGENVVEGSQNIDDFPTVKEFESVNVVEASFNIDELLTIEEFDDVNVVEDNFNIDEFPIIEEFEAVKYVVEDNQNIIDDFPTVEEIETGSDTIVVKAKRKLKYEAGDELSWKKNKNKILRMKGETYQGLKKNGEGKFHFSECKSARKLGPKCNSTFCTKNSKSRKCPFIKEEDREILFKTFWNDMSWSMT